MKDAFRALLKLHGKKRVRIPVPPEPLAIQRMYARRIKSRLLEPAMDLVRENLVPQLEAIAETASRIATTDATDDIGDVIDDISSTFFAKFTRKELGKIIRTVAQDVTKFQARALNKQLNSALTTNDAPDNTVNVVGSEPWLPRAIEEFTRENVALIRTIPEQFFSDLEKLIAREVADGGRFERLAEIIEERYGVAEGRAEFIARDQVAKFQGDLNRVRQQDLGIDKFIWRTVGDERVREEHAERNGGVYEWSNPPDDETPGEPVNCRCYAEPLLEELLPE